MSDRKKLSDALQRVEHPTCVEKFIGLKQPLTEESITMLSSFVWDQQCLVCWVFGCLRSTEMLPIDSVILLIQEQKVSLARRFALVPLGPPLLTYKSNCKAMLTADGDSVRLVVDRPYKAGEPIIIWYYVFFSCIIILVLPHHILQYEMLIT